MKNYFKFNLTGSKLFPVCLLFLVAIMVPYLAIFFKAKDMSPGDLSLLPFIIGAAAIIFLVYFFVGFFIIKLFIEGVEYQGRSFVFNGKITQFVAVVLPGLILCPLTLFIYTPWFLKNVQKFFVDNSSYDGKHLSFNGKGGDLFIILLVTFVIPFTILSTLMAIYTIAAGSEHSTLINFIYQVIASIVMVPYIYFMYKWMVNISYKDYTITWKTDAWDACLKIFVQILLSLITFGIYYPLAIVNLYKYFAERTEAVSGDRTKKFGYDLDGKNDFLFIWGQVLLIIVTVGIYYPWAMCKISDRILGKSYIEEVALEAK